MPRRFSARFLSPALFAALPLAAVALFFVLPYVAALLPGLSAAGGGRLPARLFNTAAWTFVQAVLSTLVSLLLGIPGAYIASSPGFRYKRIVRSCTAVPFALPPILMALGFVLFWGNSGFVSRALMAAFGPEAGIRALYTPQAAIFCHACYNFPIIMRLSGDAFTEIRASYSDAAYSLGASPARTAFAVILPMALPTILAASLLVFFYCLTSFMIVLLLGGPSSATLAVEIYRYARAVPDFRMAGLLSIIETAMAGTAFALYLFAIKKRESLTGGAPPSLRPPAESRATPPPRGRGPLKPPSASSALVLLLVLLAFSPAAALIIDSFSSGLANYYSGGVRLLSAFLRSLVLAVCAAAAAVLLAFPAAFAVREASRTGSGLAALVRAAAALPAASSGIVLGFGILAFFGRSQARSPLTAAAAQAVIALPFAFSAVYSGLAAVPEAVRDSANVLGAGPLRVLLKIDLPLCGRALRSAWAFSACISLGELNTILMLGIEGFETLPLYIYRAASSYRYGPASAAGCLLAASCFTALYLSDRREAGRPRRLFSY